MLVARAWLRSTGLSDPNRLLRAPYTAAFESLVSMPPFRIPRGEDPCNTGSERGALKVKWDVSAGEGSKEGCPTRIHEAWMDASLALQCTGGCALDPFVVQVRWEEGRVRSFDVEGHGSCHDFARKSHGGPWCRPIPSGQGMVRWTLFSPMHSTWFPSWVDGFLPSIGSHGFVGRTPTAQTGPTSCLYFSPSPYFWVVWDPSVRVLPVRPFSSLFFL